MSEHENGNVQAALDAGRELGAQIGVGMAADGGRHELFAIVRTADGEYKLESLECFRLKAPRNIDRALAVHDASSLMDYATTFKNEHTRMYADVQKFRVVAVLDDHGPAAPAWCDHKATLACRFDPDWEKWRDNDRKQMSQTEFAEFIEDQIEQIVSPDDSGMPTGAQMLKVATSLEATTDVKFKSGIRLASGQRQISYLETVDGSAGEDGKLDIPEEFSISVAPFEGAKAYTVPARLRYRIQGGQLVMFYALRGRERFERQVFGEILEQIREGTKLPVLCATL